MGGAQVFDVGVFRQIEGHQRLKIGIIGLCGHDPVTVFGGVTRGDHRRDQVRHDDGAGEMARGLGQDGFEHVAVAQMQMPVIGAADGERGHECGLPERVRSGMV